MRGTAMMLAAVAGLAFGAATAAAEGAGSWVGTVHAGYSKIMESKDAALYAVPGGSFAAHGNLFRMLDPVLGVGLEVGYQHYGKEPFEIPSPGGLEPGQRGDASFSSVHLTAQGIARGVRGSWRPYGTLGLGLYSLRTSLSGQLLYPDGSPIPANNFSDKQTKGKFGVNLGGGLLFKPSPESVGLSVEARWQTVFDAWPTNDGMSGLDIMTVMVGVQFN